MRSRVCMSLILILLTGCTDLATNEEVSDTFFQTEFPDLYTAFSGKLDFDNLPEYSNQAIPNYITRDNTGGNNITDSGALLGRILFYDNKLSTSNTISCASCHSQANGFGDTASVSIGVNGVTGRHSNRLINTRFSAETKFFWDERANTLEEQVTMPIRDHSEMGFSGTLGAPDFDDLIDKLSAVPYYSDLFRYVYGATIITENKIQLALAQFIRSIQSFDSPYDVGRALVPNDVVNFPNFTANENLGKKLFLDPPNLGGAGCAACHTPPEFSIDPASLNNGVIGVFGSGGTDLTNTRSPSLRDSVKPNGTSNGPFMHDASLATLEDVIDFYDNGVVNNANIDPRLLQGGSPINLNLTNSEKIQLVDFLKTLSGSNVYTNTKWSDPF